MDDLLSYIKTLPAADGARACNALAAVHQLLPQFSPQGMHAFMRTGKRHVLAELRKSYPGWGFVDSDYELMWRELFAAYERLRIFERRYGKEQPGVSLA